MEKMGLEARVDVDAHARCLNPLRTVAAAISTPYSG